MLEGEGFCVTEAYNGIEGIKQVTKSTHLIILDIMMPGMSGLKTCEEIRKFSYVPILFLTAKSHESDKLLGFMAGGDDYLVKPFSYAELFARVAPHAKLKQACTKFGERLAAGEFDVEDEDEDEEECDEYRDIYRYVMEYKVVTLGKLFDVDMRTIRKYLMKVCEKLDYRGIRIYHFRKLHFSIKRVR